MLVWSIVLGAALIVLGLIVTMREVRPEAVLAPLMFGTRPRTMMGPYFTTVGVALLVYGLAPHAVGAFFWHFVRDPETLA